MKKVMYALPKYIVIPIACIAIFFMAQAFLYNGEPYGFSFVGYGGTFVQPTFEFLGLNIYWILVLLGLAVSVIVAVLRRKEYGIHLPVAIAIGIGFFVQALIGAKILYGIERTIWRGGIEYFSMSSQSLYGTLFMSFMVIPLLAILLRKKVASMFDYITPLWLVLLCFTRFGCFIQGCCGSYDMVLFGHPIVLPEQLFEVICDLLILQLCFSVEKKKFEGTLKKTWLAYDGTLFIMLLTLYGSCRFLLEFLRKSDFTWAGMSFGQIYSVICILIGLITFFIIHQRQKRNPMHN